MRQRAALIAKIRAIESVPVIRFKVFLRSFLYVLLFVYCYLFYSYSGIASVGLPKLY